MSKTKMHEYKADPQSGAGNCTCGMAERHSRHFHEFLPRMGNRELCVCGLPENAAACHMDMVWVNDTEVISKSLLDVIKMQNMSRTEGTES